MNHPNIVKLHEVIDDPNHHKIYLVMDYVEKGQVMSEAFWKHEGKEADSVLDEEKAKKYFTDLVLGLDYIHNYAHVVHRDIKPENLLITADDELKISDFGISHVVEDGENDEITNQKGTKAFLAPEVYEKGPFKGKPADVWAAGATLYFMLCGKPPFKTNNLMKLKKMIKEEEF
eukprot:CAMPEP_0114580206 /NCGR_PEP_ID=MMETSP0125-20121206/4539_1 /TAXON_ID=485358 ORGANISM="Aristerostoma sp., Strain ATCC 50986" /NCGR_SAMPLE_ID=MMETSP0125 /ASSEMBLY_ACC=CAM_ASM_000245 /LENGTH=173 /DNA_ID=CAMNT_0001771631 /DNA_START=1731 /DNA_END=2252 /DNA_ORIENTATION=-